MMKRAKILALRIIRSANTIPKVPQLWKHLRVTCQPPVEDEQQSTATPSGIGKGQGLRHHPDTEEDSDRIEQLEFANVERSAKRILVGTRSTHGLTESAPSQGTLHFRDHDFLCLCGRLEGPDLGRGSGPGLVPLAFD